MNTWTAYHSRSISPKEQALYDHWLQCAEQESPDQLIARFRALFIEGIGYPEREAVAFLDEILSSSDVEQYFRYIINRCCHILVNRWHGRPQLQGHIPTLINCFDQQPTHPVTEVSRARSARKVREMAAHFIHTEHYTTLRRLAQVVEGELGDSNQPLNAPLGTLIGRYPYLYEHCLVNEESSAEHQQVVRRIRGEAQQKFEVDLSQYVTYRVRRSRLQKQGDAAAQTLARMRPLENPTLLSDRDLLLSIRQFSGRGADGCNSTDVAQRFLQQHRATTYGNFKEDLYDYITASVPVHYGNRKFNSLLADRLRTILPENDEQPLNDFLMVRTCSHLFNFMVVDSPRQPQHFVFLDLINNLGPVLTTGVLLKLVLICRKVKPYLERRFSLLFNHYETDTRETVSWLVTTLESLNVALSLTFGSLDVSHLLTV